MKIYHIKDWSVQFENNRTRELKSLAWVPIPNKHDGDGYTLIMERKNGPAIYGAWIACVQVASKCDVRGTLLRDGGKPHDSTSLARITRMPVALVEEMLELVSSEEIGWMQVSHIQDDDSSTASPCEITASPCDNPASGCLEGKGRERREGKEGEAASPEPQPVKDFIEAWNGTDFPKCVAIPKGRRAAIHARLAEPFFRDNWRLALDRLAASDFANGGNDRRWKADIDFFLRPDSVTKIMEGKYDNKAKQLSANAPKTVFEAKAISESCTAEIDRLKAAKDSWQWDGGTKGPLLPEIVQKIKELAAKRDEARKRMTCV